MVEKMSMVSRHQKERHSNMRQGIVRVLLTAPSPIAVKGALPKISWHAGASKLDLQLLFPISTPYTKLHSPSSPVQLPLPIDTAAVSSHAPLVAMHDSSPTSTDCMFAHAKFPRLEFWVKDIKRGRVEIDWFSVRHRMCFGHTSLYKIDTKISSYLPWSSSNCTVVRK